MGGRIAADNPGEGTPVGILVEGNPVGTLGVGILGVGIPAADKHPSDIPLVPVDILQIGIQKISKKIMAKFFHQIIIKKCKKHA